MENTLTADPTVSRQTKLYSALQRSSLDCLALNPGPSLVYLTGLHFHLSERPVLVFFAPGMTPHIVLPELELEKLKQLPYDIQSFPYGEDPAQWGNVFREALQHLNLNKKKIGVEPRQLRYLEFGLLSNAAPSTTITSAEDVLTELRMHKDHTELDAMRKAANIAQQALNATLPHVKIGITELDIATELTMQLFKAGCDPQVPFTPIVSSGPNSANPHAMPSTRKLASGDLLVIDWGAASDGYFSDITRTFAIGNVDSEYVKIYKIVLEANLSGRNAVRPGISADKVDQAARSVIEAAGYGKYFTHRTGHGLGMEGHEPPYIRAGNPLIMEPGMTFTIEPGIYLPGRNGVRIEDDVAVTETGMECLTSLPREFTQIT